MKLFEKLKKKTIYNSEIFTNDLNIYQDKAKDYMSTLLLYNSVSKMEEIFSDVMKMSGDTKELCFVCLKDIKEYSATKNKYLTAKQKVCFNLIKNILKDDVIRLGSQDMIITQEYIDSFHDKYTLAIKNDIDIKAKELDMTSNKIVDKMIPEEGISEKSKMLIKYLVFLASTEEILDERKFISFRNLYSLTKNLFSEGITNLKAIDETLIPYLPETDEELELMKKEILSVFKNIPRGKTVNVKMTKLITSRVVLMKNKVLDRQYFG